ncbi:sigma-70 family RNA polymerase sigma factor [Fulvivirgaceae bacterium BMA12]|uniref:Sigma-70 family RNA polymerase sigma factor n=1 Tax=Agaribacillus aureus TaxID=3051825 RepID=A0ABT8LCM2_9BACT|nr:sigma-70 family RNA polymerase sigma factor [Fulvivirgaceae bacterium BMA12]
MATTDPKYIQVDSSRFAKSIPSANLADKSDIEIWSMFKKGHEGAFNFIYENYFPLLFKYGHRFTKNREVVKDAIQDLFIELRAGGQNLSDTDSIKYYLFKALRWKIQQYLKKRKRFLGEDKLPVDFTFEVVDSPEISLIRRQIDEEKKMRLQKSLQSLSKRQKEAIYYFYYEHLTYAQVASIMGMSNIKSARNLIYKAIDSLKKIINLISLTLLFSLFQ